MTIIRGPRKHRDFTILDNAALQDEALSYRARGLLAYLLSMPPDWRTDARAMARSEQVEGRHAILSGLRELEARGYLRRVRTQDERGRWSTDTEVCEERDITAGRTEDQLPDAGQPNAGQPNAGAPNAGGPGPIERTITKNDYKGGARQATPSLAAPPAAAPLEDDSAVRCKRHRLEASPPPCHACAARRRTAEAAAAQERARQLDADVAARAEAIEQCDLCDGEGYRGHRLCGHDPEQDERNRRGIEAARAALGKATETGAGCTINAPHHHN